MGALRSSGRGSWRVLLVTVVVSGLVVGFGLSPVGAVSEAQTVRVSVSSTGTQSDEWSYDPSISADGRFVAFTSDASNLVEGDTNEAADVFVYDRTAQQTQRVSVSSTGAQGNYNSGSYHYSGPSISADGRFVAFSSDASNLVEADTNDFIDVFVHDRSTQQTQRVSVSSTGTQANHDSYTPSISADGRFVAFESSAWNLVDADTNARTDVFVYDRSTQRTRRVSVSSTGTQGNGWSYQPSISADGRFVAFASDARNLVRADTNREGDVFVHNRATHFTRRVSVSSIGTQGNGWSNDPEISADGRFVAFASDARNLVRDRTNDWMHVFVHNRSTDRTRLASVSSTGTQGDGTSYDPAISAHGRFVTFRSEASNLVRDHTNGVFVHDRSTDRTRPVGVSSTGTPANGESYAPSISSDGRFVAFDSDARNLVEADTNNAMDVFVRGPLH